MKKFFDRFTKQKRKVSLPYGLHGPMAKLIDKFTDIILVGDSLGPVLYGFKSTRDVTLDIIINHAKSVVKNAKRSFVVVDMPYGTYENSKGALKNAKIIRETKADGVKLGVVKKFTKQLIF